MKYNVLGKTSEHAIIELRKNTAICVICAVLAVFVNVTFTVASDEQTRTLFLYLNILVDVVAGAFIYTCFFARIRTQKKLMCLYMREKEIIRGRVDEIYEEEITHLAIECFTVKIGGRMLFLPINTIQLAVGEEIAAYYSANVIVEVEKC